MHRLAQAEFCVSEVRGEMQEGQLEIRAAARVLRQGVALEDMTEKDVHPRKATLWRVE